MARKIAFTAYYDPDDEEFTEIDFEPPFDRNNYPEQMVTKLDVLHDIIAQLVIYYNLSLAQFGKKKKRRKTTVKSYRRAYHGRTRSGEVTAKDRTKVGASDLGDGE